GSVTDEVDPAPTVPTEATKSIPFSAARPDGVGLRTAMVWVTAVAAVLLVTLFIAPKDSENNQPGGNSVAAKYNAGDRSAIVKRQLGKVTNARFEQQQKDVAKNSTKDSPSIAALAVHVPEKNLSNNDGFESKNGLDALEDSANQFELSKQQLNEVQLDFSFQAASKKKADQTLKALPTDSPANGIFATGREFTLAIPSEPLVVFVDATPRTHRHGSVEQALLEEGFSEQEEGESLGQRGRHARRSVPSPLRADVRAQLQIGAAESRAPGQVALNSAVRDYQVLVVTSTANEIESALTSLRRRGFAVTIHDQTRLLAKELADRQDNKWALVKRGNLSPFADLLRTANQIDRKAKLTAEAPASDAASQPSEKLEKDDRAISFAKEKRRFKDGQERSDLNTEEAKGGVGGAASDIGGKRNKFFYRAPDGVLERLARELTMGDTENETADNVGNAEFARDKSEATDESAALEADADIARALGSRQVLVIFVIRDAPKLLPSAAAAKEEKKP
ncbi:MAG: hypothetical protein IH991_25530, partial [Planctomycetes bacterium]|nr:hypothetical protein [Planctomycetota bacterium]